MPMPTWSIVPAALCQAPVESRHTIAWLFAGSVGMLMLQVWDVRNAAGPAGTAELLSVVAGVAGMLIVAVTTVLSAGGVARAITPAAAFLIDYTLADLEARLGAAFVRVSRGDLVNIDWIERIASDGDGSATLTLRDTRPVHVSPRRAATVRRAIER